MVYKVSFSDVLQAWLVPVRFSFLAIFLGIAILGIIVLLWLKMHRAPGRDLLVGGGILMFVLVGPPLIFASLYAGSGVRLKEGRLEITIGLRSPESLVLENTLVSLIATGGEWDPVYRRNGIGLPGLSCGSFRFKNGKTALYFRHGDSQYRLVLNYQDTYYVVSFPQVESLYYEILARGGKPIEKL